MLILGIETSCDETSASVLRCEKKTCAVLSNVVSSQIKLHSEWGGVVPNLAAREHLKNILPVIEESLKKANVSPRELDLLSVTHGPGLIPALLIGTATAKTLSYLWEKPLIGIHHIEGHIYANFITDTKLPASTRGNYRSSTRGGQNKNESTNIFPVLCLVVSGGHTQLVLMQDHLQYEIVGQTLDDAAGEAFDKVARMLDLDYPGGPAIAKIAANYILGAENSELALPRPMLNSKDLNFSFSGLKTAVLYKIKKIGKINDETKTALCHEFQQAVIDVLIIKTIRAAKIFHAKTIMLAGGVSANLELRSQLATAIKNNLPKTYCQILDTKYSLDNAAMIAAAAYWRYNTTKDKSIFEKNWKKLKTEANLKLR